MSRKASGLLRPGRKQTVRSTLCVVLTTALVWSMGWISLIFRASAQTTTPAAVGIHKVQGASWRPDRAEPLFVAVLGSDVRSGPPDGGGGRCDGIHIVAINPVAKGGTILNFPRDSWVNIAGRGMDKINSACSSGGAELMVQTLKNLTGIPIHFFAITEFSHFIKFIDELGGIDVHVPYAMADSPSGAFFQAGPIRMTGGQALSFTRNRKDTPRGDFSRADNQGILIQAALVKYKAEAADAHRVLDYIRSARRHIRASAPVMDLVRLGLLAKDIDPAQLKNVTMPGSTGSAGGASVVFLAPGDIYDRVRDDAIL